LERTIINKQKNNPFTKFVVFVKPGQNKLLRKQNSNRSYSLQKPSNDFNLYRRIKRKIKGSPLTHTYIFHGFYRAAKYLNLETFWIDNQKDLDHISDEKTIVFCEGSFMPDLNKKLESKYIVHSIPKYLVRKCRELSEKKICLNLEVFKKEAIDFYQLNELAFFDEKSFTLYQPWATNLLPNEFREFDNKDAIRLDNICYYIGLLYGSGSKKADNLNTFLQKSKSQTEIRCVTGASDSLARELTLRSSICIDIRSGHHLEVGYVPCRVFKTLSYGREIFVNSKSIKDLLNHIPNVKYYSSGEDLRNQYENFCSIHNSKKFNDDQNFTLNYIKNNHTFINRLNNIFEVFN
tara:strand:+ start:2260 stop:3306 length:1047 start_codon:yes stop_codon:yes gene_type:complete